MTKHSFFRCCLAGFVLLTGNARAAPQNARLSGDVVDEHRSPVAGVEITLQSSGGLNVTSYTDTGGRFAFPSLEPGDYLLVLAKPDFFRLSRQVQLSQGENEISLSISHETEIHERVEVSSAADQVVPQNTGHENALVAREIRDIPVPSTHDLKSSLPAMAEVVRDNSAHLHIGGGRVGEAQFVLDGLDIGDPVNNDLVARVNVDSVRVAEAQTGIYSAQFGGGGTGVLSLDTSAGDDQWRVTATNFIPGINVQDGVRLGNWYPRVTISGPLSKGKAWFSEALSIQHSTQVISELPPDSDTITQWSGDNLLRAQIKLTPSNILQGAFLNNQQDANNHGLGPFSPIETTTDLRSHWSFYSLKDQVWTKGTYYEFGVAFDIGRTSSLPKGSRNYVVTPTGTAGNYFEGLREDAHRWQAAASVTMPSRKWHGAHTLQFGLSAKDVSWTHNASRSAIEVLDANEAPIRQTTFFGQAQFHESDRMAGGYAQDTWQAGRHFVFQFGARADWDQILHQVTPSPRFSASFLPFKNDRAKLRAGWGVFVQPLLLGILGPALDQERQDVLYDTAGQGPVLGPVTSRFALSEGHLDQPRFHTTSVGWEQKIGQNSFVEIDLMNRKEISGLAYELVLSNETTNIFLLQNRRRDTYRSAEFTFRHSFGESAGLKATYVRSRAHTNEVFDYSLGTIVFAPQQAGPLAWDAPNRFISSGWAPAPFWHLLVSYFLEYRTGFPFSTINDRQQLVGTANSHRFPDYFSLNLGIEKPVRLFGRDWAVRLAILNITDHANPNSVINNIDAPDFLTFAGGQKLAFTARVRLVK